MTRNCANSARKFNPCCRGVPSERWCRGERNVAGDLVATKVVGTCGDEEESMGGWRRNHSPGLKLGRMVRETRPPLATSAEATILNLSSAPLPSALMVICDPKGKRREAKRQWNRHRQTRREGSRRGRASSGRPTSADRSDTAKSGSSDSKKVHRFFRRREPENGGAQARACGNLRGRRRERQPDPF